MSFSRFTFSLSYVYLSLFSNKGEKIWDYIDRFDLPGEALCLFCYI